MHACQPTRRLPTLSLHSSQMHKIGRDTETGRPASSWPLLHTSLCTRPAVHSPSGSGSVSQSALALLLQLHRAQSHFEVSSRDLRGSQYPSSVQPSDNGNMQHQHRQSQQKKQSAMNALAKEMHATAKTRRKNGILQKPQHSGFPRGPPPWY